MPGKPDTEDWRVECSGQIQFQSSIYSQPWWRGVGENASKSSSTDQRNGSVVNGATRSENNEGLPDGVDFSRQNQQMVSPTGGDVGKEHQSINHVMSSTPLTMAKQPGTNSQMELVSHSIVLTSYPYPDAQYGGILTTYGPQAMIHPQLYGMHHARMPLPLEMEEEPVYVNAKQYHGILRRRQSRAKAELEKKVVKVRKPYLHESRHLHAMRRARGCGGRFLNTKKLEGNNSDAFERGNHIVTDPSTISGNSPAIERLLTNNENLGSSNDQHDASKSMLQDLHKVQGFTIGYRNGNDQSSVYHSHLNGKNDGDFSGQERKSISMHGAPNRAIK